MNITNITLNETLWSINTLKNSTSFAFNKEALLECKNLCASSLSGLSNNKQLILPGIIVIIALIILLINEFKKEEYERETFLIIIYILQILINISFVLYFLEVI